MGGGKLFTIFLLLTLVSSESMSQKENISKQLEICVIFSSTQQNSVKRKIVFVCLGFVFVLFLFFFCVPQLYLWGSPLLGEIFAYVTVF